MAISSAKYITAGPNEDEYHINLASRTRTRYNLKKIGNPTFEANKGVTGSLDGSSCFDTGYIPGRGKLVLLEGELDVFVCTNTYDPIKTSQIEFGNSYSQIRALQTQLLTGAPTTGGARITRNVTQNTPNNVVKNAIGLTSIARYRATSLRIFRNAVQVSGGGGLAIGFGTDTFKIGQGSARRIGFASAGARIPDEHRLRWYTAINTLMLKLGAYDPEDLDVPPIPAGGDPYAPPADVVWTDAYKGTALNMAGYTLTHDSTFDTQDKLSTISPDGGQGPWFAPVRSRVGYVDFLPPDAPVSPFSIQNGALRIRMEIVNGKWQTGHMQTAASNGAGFAQTLGYFEAKIKMPPDRTKAH